MDLGTRVRGGRRIPRSHEVRPSTAGHAHPETSRAARARTASPRIVRLAVPYHDGLCAGLLRGQGATALGDIQATPRHGAPRRGRTAPRERACLAYGRGVARRPVSGHRPPVVGRLGGSGREGAPLPLSRLTTPRHPPMAGAGPPPAAAV